VLTRKELQRFKHEAYKISIIPIGYSRINHLEERGNNTIHESVEQENSNSSVIMPTI